MLSMFLLRKYGLPIVFCSVLLIHTTAVDAGGSMIMAVDPDNGAFYEVQAALYQQASQSSAKANNNPAKASNPSSTAKPTPKPEAKPAQAISNAKDSKAEAKQITKANNTEDKPKAGVSTDVNKGKAVEDKSAQAPNSTTKPTESKANTGTVDTTKKDTPKAEAPKTAVAKAEASKPDTVKAEKKDTPKAEAPKTAVAKAEASKPGTAKAESSKAEKPDATKTEPTKPDVAKAEAPAPKASKPDAATEVKPTTNPNAPSPEKSADLPGPIEAAKASDSKATDPTKKITAPTKEKLQPLPSITDMQQSVPLPLPRNEEDIQYYQQCPQPPLEVSLENYREAYLSLRGLKGVYINVEDVLKGARGKGVEFSGNLLADMTQKLNDAGLRLLTKVEMEYTPGQPQMSMYVSFPDHLNTPKKGEPAIVYRPDCCAASIWTSFAQGAVLIRDATANFKLPTWGEGHKTADCSDIPGWTRSVVMQTIDDFIADYKKANLVELPPMEEVCKVPAATDVTLKKVTEKAAQQEPPLVTETAKVSDTETKPDQKQPPTETKKVTDTETKPDQKQPEPASSQPMAKQLIDNNTTYDVINNVSDLPIWDTLNCSAAVLLYAEIFATNSSTIEPNMYQVLNKLTGVMKSCPAYHYVIETHADQRGELDYNDMLSAARAISIRDYLLTQGVDAQQFMMHAYGERRPLRSGTTAEDYAANRRVVVAPYLSK